MKTKKNKTDKTLEWIIGSVIAIASIFGMFLFREDVDYRNEKYCKRVENEARYISAAVYDYFAWPEHTDIKKSDIEEGAFTDNPWTLTDNGDELVIQVIDESKKCSKNYQESSPQWDSGRYTFKILKSQVK